MVGGELRLIELARGLPRLGDGRHRQVVRGEVPQVCQLRLTGLIVCIIGNFPVYGEIEIRARTARTRTHQVQVGGVCGGDVYFSLVVAVVER